MSAQFTIIDTDNKKLTLIQACINLKDPEEVKMFIKSVRELAEKSKEPIKEDL